jgi:hypothetical protein
MLIRQRKHGRSEPYSEQKQKASGAHEAVLEHVAAQNITLAEAALTHFNAENPVCY